MVISMLEAQQHCNVQFPRSCVRVLWLDRLLSTAVVPTQSAGGGLFGEHNGRKRCTFRHMIGPINIMDSPLISDGGPKWWSRRNWGLKSGEREEKKIVQVVGLVGKDVALVVRSCANQRKGGNKRRGELERWRDRSAQRIDWSLWWAETWSLKKGQLAQSTRVSEAHRPPGKSHKYNISHSSPTPGSLPLFGPNQAEMWNWLQTEGRRGFVFFFSFGCCKLIDQWNNNVDGCDGGRMAIGHNGGSRLVVVGIKRTSAEAEFHRQDGFVCFVDSQSFISFPSSLTPVCVTYACRWGGGGGFRFDVGQKTRLVCRWLLRRLRPMQFGIPPHGMPILIAAVVRVK